MAKDALRRYTAFRQNDHADILFRGVADPQAALPPEAEPIDDPRSTYFRRTGDRFEFAFFRLNGQAIVVQRDGKAPIRR